MLSYARGVETFTITPIAHVASPRAEPIDDDWAGVESTITLTPAFTADALRGLGEFSHIEVVYLFHLVDPGSITSGLSAVPTDPVRPGGAGVESGRPHDSRPRHARPVPG